MPAERYPVSFALLLNLVSASNAHNRDVLWGFIRAYSPEPVSPQANPGLDRLVGFALRYYEDFVKPTKVFRAPDEKERAAMLDLNARLLEASPRLSAEELQSIVYEVGKAHSFENLRDWSRSPALRGAFRGEPKATILAPLSKHMASSRRAN